MRWLVAFVVVVGVAVLAWWFATRDENQSLASANETSQIEVVTGTSSQDSSLRTERAQASSNSGEPKRIDLKGQVLDPKAPEFADTVADVIRREYMIEVAACFDSDIPLNDQITVEVDLKIANGEVSAANPRVSENTLSSKKEQDCVLQTISNARFLHEQMPDWDESLDLYVSGRSIQKYRRWLNEDVE